MGTPDRTRVLESWGFRLRDADVKLSEFALAVWKKDFRGDWNTTQSNAARFSALCQALKEGDAKEADKILRSWRIRR